ncbi:baseplate hub protein [Asaia astilbis]
MSETTTATASRLPSSFTAKKIEITFTTLTKGGNPTILDQETLKGFRCQVDVTNAGLAVGSSANARIYGLSLPMMNRMSLMPSPVAAIMSPQERTNLNHIQISAGDDERGMTTIYNGTIFSAFADFSSVPEPAFNITSHTVIVPSTSPIAPHSFPAGTDIATMASQIASDAGYSFANFGVNGKAIGPTYVYGTVGDQIKQLCGAHRFIYDFENKGAASSKASPQHLTIWSNNLSDIALSAIPKVSSATGMIGYPTYNNSGVSITTLFDPRLNFMSPFAIDSQFLPAAWVNNQAGQIAPMPVNGTWRANMVTHSLDSEIPNGQWFTRVDAIRNDFAGSLR